MWEIYCDESRITKCKYMFIGALVVPPYAKQPFAEADQVFRTGSNNNHAHFKWEKACSRKFLPSYVGFVDLFFIHNVRFKAIIIEKSQVDYPKYHRDDRELGFYKFYFLLLSRLVDFGKTYDVKIHRRPDKNRGRLIDLQAATNNWCRKKSGRYITPVISLNAVAFENHSELQMVDVLMGATGYHWDRCHLKPDASKSKIEICNHICKKLDRASLEFESDWRDKKFNLWKWKAKI